MSVDTSADLNRWLKTATRGLPHDIAELVSDEIRAHYDDARREHKLCGLSPLEAHRAAMAELGDGQATSHALHDTHLAEQRYLKAAFMSIAPSIVFVVALFVQVSVGQDGLESGGFVNVVGLMGLLTFVCLVYVLHSFKILLAGRFNFHGIDLPISIIKWSLLGIVVSSLLSRFLSNQQTVLLFNDPMIVVNHSLTDARTLLDAGLDVFDLAGILILGLGWLLLSDRLAGVEDYRYGLVTPLRYVLLVNSFAIIASGIAMLFGLHNAGVLAVTAVVVVGTVKYALWTLLFFRAAFRGSNQPIQTA